MADLVELDKLLSLLSKHSITHFKNADLEIEISLESKTPRLAVPGPQPLEEIKIDESNMPPDLRADDLFNADKVMLWSGSPDPEPFPIPLTGEE